MQLYIVYHIKQKCKLQKMIFVSAKTVIFSLCAPKRRLTERHASITIRFKKGNPIRFPGR